MKTQYLLHCF